MTNDKSSTRIIQQVYEYKHTETFIKDNLTKHNCHKCSMYSKC